MSPDELRVAAGRLVAQRAEQGLGERVDRATLARIAALIGEIAPTTTKTPSGKLGALISGDGGSASAPTAA